MTRRSVVYVQYSEPGAYPPVVHSARTLADAGWRVTVLGIGLMGVNSIGFPAHPDISVHVRPWCAPGWRQKLHYFRFFVWALAVIVWRRADWVYISDALAAPVGQAASLLTPARVLYHEHDAPAGTSQTWFQRVIGSSRRFLLRHAAVVVVPNAERGRDLVTQGLAPERLRVVWNCPARHEIRTSARSATPGTDFWLLYHGTIVPARVPLTVIEALATLPPHIKLRIRGYETAGHIGYVESLLSRARALGVADRVDIQPAVDRDRLMPLVDDCDLGLALLPLEPGDVNERHMTGASNKVFDYLARGVPVLVTDRPEWQQVFVASGCAHACRPDSVQSISTAVRWFETHRAETARMGEVGRQRVANDWNYEQQFATVFSEMQSVGDGVAVHAHPH